MSFIYVGRLDVLKGIRTLIDAWKIMGHDAPHLIVCGTGPLEEWLNSQIKEHRINLEMKGFVDNIDTKKLIAESQALVLPTLWYEGFPMTIIEAYSVGTPVICSDLGNVGSLVAEDITGWKFKAGSAEELADVVRRKHKDIRDSTRQVYKEKYTVEKNYKLMIDIYERAKP